MRGHTYKRIPGTLDDYDPATILCDEHSSFDDDGFASDGRCWTPHNPGPCAVCGN